MPYRHLNVTVKSYKNIHDTNAQILIIGSNSIVYLFEGVLAERDNINSFKCSSFNICRVSAEGSKDLMEARTKEKKDYEYSSTRNLLIENDDIDFLAMVYDWVADAESSSILIS
ncbi:hypothetical protein FACS1894147_00920 [Spirochaetia bacterium]|nr:hypothetical protein FACS1894147_00920 [Spirochaetia bacterium]